MGDGDQRKRWKVAIILGGLVSLLLAIAVICLANIRNEQVFEVLDTYPGKRSLYLGHDLCTGFAAYVLVVALFTMVYTMLCIAKHRKIQVMLIFSFLISSVMLAGSSITVFWSANGGTQSDEHHWLNEYNDASWKHSTAWDWMTQTLYYDYGDNWKNLMRENECCGVRGPYEMGAIRALWTNKTDIFSQFALPTECCSNDASTDQGLYDCRKAENHHETGCYKKVVRPEFIKLGSVSLALSAFNLFVSFWMVYFYIYNHKPWFSGLDKIRC